jgi:glycosyltransferase involved in cell wall biosynthesis
MKYEDSRASIFRRYYMDEPFVDRFATDPKEGVDVIIPIIHTNELWDANLRSIYREIPVSSLLLGDGGCIDDSLEIAKKFPRVTVLDHRDTKSLGFSIRKLIEAVKTDWFIYLHSDVYLPEGWFDAMKNHQGEFDWFGCPMRHTIMVEYSILETFRPYAGSQMGRTNAFRKGLHRIDDDYVYRQEDFIFSDLITREGFKEGRIENTFHYHQTMHKESSWSRKIKNVAINVEWSRDEEIRAATMQIKGVLKYLEPSRRMFSWIEGDIMLLTERGELDPKKLRQWIRDINPAWLTYYRPWRLFLHRMVRKIRMSKVGKRL